MVANPVNAGKGLMQRVEAMIRAALPRQAIVTRNDGSGVFVRFVGEDAGSPESRFPSTVAGVPVGTVGWVATLAGGKGLFIVTNIWQPVPIDLWSGNSVNTTSLTTPTMLIDSSITLPPGTWEIRCNFTAKLWRSVNSGNRMMYVQQDANGGPLGDPPGDGSNKTMGNQIVRNARIQVVNITEERAVPLRLGVYGQGTAGTTYMAYGAITGQAIRIGAPT